MRFNAVKEPSPKALKAKSHIPTGSFFYGKIIPVLLVVMAILTITFIVIAAGVLFGVVPYR